MKPRILLDENVCLRAATRLRGLGYDTETIAERTDRGLADEDVLATAVALGAVLVRRDAHFKNPIRFNVSTTAGIIHIVHGNLTADDEADLVASFLESTPPEQYHGRLVLLSRAGAIIR